jgi:hypothetical protein
MDAGLLPQVAVCLRSNKHGRNAAIDTFPVIAAKVSCVGGGLVDICQRRLSLAFELNNHHSGADKEEDVRASGFEWKFVLEDRGVVLRADVAHEDFGHLALQRKDGIPPSTNLLW